MTSNITIFNYSGDFGKQNIWQISLGINATNSNFILFSGHIDKAFQNLIAMFENIAIVSIHYSNYSLKLI